MSPTGRGGGEVLRGREVSGTRRGLRFLSGRREGEKEGGRDGRRQPLSRSPTATLEQRPWVCPWVRSGAAQTETPGPAPAACPPTALSPAPPRSPLPAPAFPCPSCLF